MIIVDCEQRSPEWLALRRGVITASAADRLLTPAKMDELAIELAGERMEHALPEQPVTFAMQQGMDREPEAKLRFAFERNAHVVDVGFCWMDGHEGDIGCSPDGLVGDNGMVEVKAPQQKQHTKNLLADACPAQYLPQCQFQLMVSGRQWCDLVSYRPENETCDFIVHRVMRDEAYIAALYEKAQKCLEMIRGYCEKASRRRAA